jgi:hypothetical protein
MGGKPIKPLDKFGHYLFVGKQGGGKTLSAIWYMELLKRKYEKKRYRVQVFSNIGIGESIDHLNLFSIVNKFDPYVKTVRIVILDEVQAYFPRDTKNKHILEQIDELVGLFSQLRKRNTYILSTAQVYGRLNKSLREQCLYMVNCRKSKLTNRVLSEFIDGDDVMCDDLGRWSGVPSFIYTHGLPKTTYDTRKIITRSSIIGSKTPPPKGDGGVLPQPPLQTPVSSSPLGQEDDYLKSPLFPDTS